MNMPLTLATNRNYSRAQIVQLGTIVAESRRSGPRGLAPKTTIVQVLVFQHFNYSATFSLFICSPLLLSAHLQLQTPTCIHKTIGSNPFPSKPRHLNPVSRVRLNKKGNRAIGWFNCQHMLVCVKHFSVCR